MEQNEMDALIGFENWLNTKSRYNKRLRKAYVETQALVDELLAKESNAGLDSLVTQA